MTLSDIRRAWDSVVLPRQPEFPFPLGEGCVSYATNESIRCFSQEESAADVQFYWEIAQCGLLYAMMSTSSVAESSDQRTLDYIALVRRVAIQVAVMAQMYSELGLDAELLTLTFRISNTEGTVLRGTDLPPGGAYRCFIPEVEVVKRRTVADLLSGPAAHAARIVEEICERFGVRSEDHVALPQRLETFLRHGTLRAP
jgi:hypothetical protein